MPFISPNDGGLKDLFKDHLPNILWQPVERSSAVGLPDLHFLHQGISGWIENKLAKSNKLQHPPTPQQIAWVERYARNNGRILCAVRKKNDSARNHCDELYIFHGLGIRFLLLGIEAVPARYRLGHFPGFRPSDWDWARIREKLIS